MFQKDSQTSNTLQALLACQNEKEIEKESQKTKEEKKIYPHWVLLKKSHLKVEK